MLKKAKQKPKSEEDELADFEHLIERTATELAATLTKENGEKIVAVEKEIELLKTRWMLKHHIVMDSNQYDCINRRLSLYDIDVGSKDLILRLDLDIPLSKFTVPQRISDALSHGRSQEGITSVGRLSNKDTKKSDIESVVSVSPLGDQEDWWKARQILDRTWVKKVVAELRYCMERMCNRVFVIGNLGEKHGKIMGENSMKIIQNELQQHILDIPIHFLPNANSKDFVDKKLNDEFADNSIYVVENLNFHPEEFGYVEPDPKVAEDASVAEQDDPAKRPLSGKDAKQPHAAEKGADKHDKHADKHADKHGDKHADKLAAEKLAAEKQRAASGKPEGEEKAPEEVKPPPFTASSIHAFKKRLGVMGEIYINDAPLASLSTSNTVNEIKCPKKVMGLTMTEELRSIAQFFMKKFPLDIDSIYYKMPSKNLEYFQIKSTAIIGGICKTSSDLLEKILLANSFLDTFS